MRKQPKLHGTRAAETGVVLFRNPNIDLRENVIKKITACLIKCSSYFQKNSNDTLFNKIMWCYFAGLSWKIEKEIKTEVSRNNKTQGLELTPQEAERITNRNAKIANLCDLNQSIIWFIANLESALMPAIGSLEKGKYIENINTFFRNEVNPQRRADMLVNPLELLKPCCA